MLYLKKGFPEEGDMVFCTVKKVSYHSVFCSLDEYENKEGMIHISEVSPGRIRNLRDFVREGKKVVCKVLRTNPERNHIDLSLRRVNQSQKTIKNEEIKQESKAEKLLEMISKELKTTPNKLFEEIGKKIIEKYGSLYEGFQRITIDPDLIKEFKLKKETEKVFIKIIQEKVKIPEVAVKGFLIIKSTLPNGAEIIKKVLLDSQKGKIKVTYVSAPRYKIEVTASDYKTAEELLKNAQESIVTQIKEAKGEAEFIRKK